MSPGSSGVKGNNPLVRSLSAASDLRYLKQWFWDSLLQGFLMRPNSKRRSDHESTRGLSLPSSQGSQSESLA